MIHCVEEGTLGLSRRDRHWGGRTYDINTGRAHAGQSQIDLYVKALSEPTGGGGWLYPLLLRLHGGGARLKSGALELHILKSLKRVPGQSFEDIFPRYP